MSKAAESHLLASAAVLLATLAWGPVLASPPVWVMQGKTNTIRIAGSVHYLRASDHPLPEPLRRAFHEADVLVVEYDARGGRTPVRPMDLAATVPRAGLLRPPGPLRRAVSTPEFTELRRLAEAQDIDIFRLDRMKPWFAAMYVVDVTLGRAGFDSALGVDNYLIALAHGQGKPVRGLESGAEQRELFAGVPNDDQIDFLVESLKDAPRMAGAMGRLVEHWRAGDVNWLEWRLLRDLRANPDEYERFSVTRNRRWADAITALAGEERDYLVVVGVVHLLGEDSLLGLLRRRGFDPKPWP